MSNKPEAPVAGAYLANQRSIRIEGGPDSHDNPSNARNRNLREDTNPFGISGDCTTVSNSPIIDNVELRYGPGWLLDLGDVANQEHEQASEAQRINT